MPRRSQPPQGFVTLAPGIYMSIPRAGSAVWNLDDSAPSVIVIFAWMGGTTRHIQHYVNKYAELYPSATQIIVKCGMSVFWKSLSWRKKRLLPVTQALECLGCLPSGNDLTRDRPRVLLHSFSNGGSYQLAALGNLLADKYPSVPASERLHSAFILDSSPGFGGSDNISKAITSTLKNPILVMIAIPVLLIYYMILRLTIFGGEDATARLYKELLHPHLLPWMGMHTPRLYVYSKTDEVVPCREVQQHIDGAKAVGFLVHTEMYEKSSHVSHMRTDGDRYWSAVQGLWKESCRLAQTRVETAKIVSRA